MGNWLSCPKVISPEVTFLQNMTQLSPEISVMLPEIKCRVSGRNNYLKDQTYRLWIGYKIVYSKNKIEHC